MISGKVYRFGHDVDTDAIIPARYLATTDAEELAKHCMEDIDPTFYSRVEAGGIIVAGKNFGCGSSREHAPIAIKAAGIACVVAESFARIFYRNAINIGLPILEAPEAVRAMEEGDHISIDLEAGKIITADGREYQAVPFPPFMQELIAAGGLIEYVRRRVSKHE